MVSAGHTGAVVAASVLKLRTLPGVIRPAVACLIPTETKVFVLIDAGANPDSDAHHLVQFAIMGSICARYVLGRQNPRIGLMSIAQAAYTSNQTPNNPLNLLKRPNLT